MQGTPVVVCKVRPLLYARYARCCMQGTPIVCFSYACRHGCALDIFYFEYSFVHLLSIAWGEVILTIFLLSRFCSSRRERNAKEG